MLVFQRFDYIKLISYQRVKKCECLNVFIQGGARKTGPPSLDQRGRRSRTLYRELNKCKCKVLTG
jgi:hypothetical protein